MRKRSKENMGYVYLAFAIAGELIGTTYLKYSEGYTKPLPTIVSIAAYGICFYLFSKSLLTINLSIAYATWSAVGLIITALISVFVFREGITPAGIAALIMITAGVIILNLYGAPIKG
jgi:small multidrug resistance pump